MTGHERADWTEELALAGLRARGFRSRRLPGDLHLLDAKGKGELPPILLVHGLGSCAADYLPLLVRLVPRHRRVLAIDLPGHGRTPLPREGLGAREAAEIVVRALDALDTEPLLLFGCSLGGLFALRLAGARPERVRAVMLASPAGAPMPGSELAALLGSFDLRDHAGALSFVDRFLAPRPRALAGPRRHLFAWGVRRRFTRAPLATLLRGVSADDLLTAEELAAIGAPVTVFWGSADRVLPPRHATFFRAHLPTVRVEEVDGYGHAPFLDQPEAFAARLEAFARGAA